MGDPGQPNEQASALRSPPTLVGHASLGTGSGRRGLGRGRTELARRGTQARALSTHLSARLSRLSPGAPDWRS